MHVKRSWRQSEKAEPSLQTLLNQFSNSWFLGTHSINRNDQGSFFRRIAPEFGITISKLGKDHAG